MKIAPNCHVGEDKSTPTFYRDREIIEDPIRVINFLDFRKLNKFPRYPNNKSICYNLENIDFSKSFLIFLSHCWLRGSPSSEGWDGIPNPDNLNNEKYKLTVEAIEKIWGTSAFDFEECYIWIDYGCINQDGDPAGELRQLDKIVQRCDCMLTIVVDKEWKEWDKDYQSTMDGLLSDYKAASWTNYLSRAWCRVEMLYAANIPLIHSTTTTSGTDRIEKFQFGLRGAMESNRRAHLLYGTRESEKCYYPGNLCPLKNSYLEEHNPLKGHLSQEGDRKKINDLMRQLLPYITKVECGYIGQKNAIGLREGTGKLILDNGFVYEGTWMNDIPSGKGKILLPNGDLYIGELQNGSITGQGIFYGAMGNIQTGHWEEGVMNGQGEYLIKGYQTYTGEFRNGVIEGYGTCRHVDGTLLYQGYFEDGMPMMKGSLLCPWFCCKFYSCLCLKIMTHDCCYCRKYNPQEEIWYISWSGIGSRIIDKMLCGILGTSNGGKKGMKVSVFPNITETFSKRFTTVTESNKLSRMISDSILL